jgi:hypothetical protein
MRIAQEVQSRFRTDATNLETTKEYKDVLEIDLQEVQLEHEEEKQRLEKLKHKLEEVFQMIPDNTIAEDLNEEEMIEKITHTIDRYKQEITKLDGRITPMTPPEVRIEREKQEKKTHISLRWK